MKLKKRKGNFKTSVKAKKQNRYLLCILREFENKFLASFPVFGQFNKIENQRTKVITERQLQQFESEKKNT